MQRPTLVIAHNKTLAAQLATEFKEFFPDNAVEYFVSYYDYYQPEAYLPRTDLYIEKDADINEELDKLRHAATRALLTRRDVLIVASVSCIFGLGSPEEYQGFMAHVQRGEIRSPGRLSRQLIDMQYERNDFDLARGRFRIRGDTLEILPAYETIGVRIEFWGDEVERIVELDPLTGEVLVRAQRHRHLSRPSTSSPLRRSSWKPSGASRRSWKTSSSSSTGGASCWRRRGWSSAPGTT